jgi:hypothetical protein
MIFGNTLLQGECTMAKVSKAGMKKAKKKKKVSKKAKKGSMMAMKSGMKR